MGGKLETKHYWLPVPGAEILASGVKFLLKHCLSKK
jgi:hypothetical protein